MITLFTSCFHFGKDRDIIQKNALQSWVELRNKKNNIEIIIFGKEQGVSDIAKKLNIRNYKDIKYDEFNLPLVKSIFDKAQEIAKNNLLCYINSDIILTEKFVSALLKISEKFEQFLAVGQRYDIDIFEEIDFDNINWEVEFSKIVNEKGILHRPCGMDYFAFKKGLWKDIPDFTLARGRFDNWFVWKAVTSGVPTVDLTQFVTVIHQNHERHPKPEELEKNFKLGIGKMMDANHSKYILTKDGEIKIRL